MTFDSTRGCSLTLVPINCLIMWCIFNVPAIALRPCLLKELTHSECLFIYSSFQACFSSFHYLFHFLFLFILSSLYSVHPHPHPPLPLPSPPPPLPLSPFSSLFLPFPPFTDAVAITGAEYGPGEGTIFLDSFLCSGLEATLLDCFHRRAGNTTCSHLQDSSVKCSRESCMQTPPPPPSPLPLPPPPSPSPLPLPSPL